MRRQRNTANNGSVYAAQSGNINISGPPEPARPGQNQEPAAAERVRVLMLAANPGSTPRLGIDEEARAIAERLRLSRDRDAFELITCWAVRPTDLLQHLNLYSPHIVHFSGHGDRIGEIVLAAGDGTDQRVDAAGLADVFRVANERISVVVLNSCRSAVAADGIGQHVDYVVGMRVPVTDEAATVFAGAFYSALGFGRPIPQAFEQAVAVLRTVDPGSHGIPELLARPNANPHLRTHCTREGEQ